MQKIQEKESGMTLEEAHETVAEALNALRPIFIAKAELTFIMRIPGNSEGDMIITNDDLSELRELVERSMQREEVEQS